MNLTQTELRHIIEKLRLAYNRTTDVVAKVNLREAIADLERDGR